MASAISPSYFRPRASQRMPSNTIRTWAAQMSGREPDWPEICRVPLLSRGYFPTRGHSAAGRSSGQNVPVFVVRVWRAHRTFAGKLPVLREGRMATRPAYLYNTQRLQRTERPRVVFCQARGVDKSTVYFLACCCHRRAWVAVDALEVKRRIKLMRGL